MPANNGEEGGTGATPYPEGEGRRTSTVLQKDVQGLYLHQKIQRPVRDPRTGRPLEDKITEIELVQLLGRGGMATTYVGKTETGSECCMKILPVIPGNADNEKFVERFEGEAKNLRRLTKEEDVGFVQMIDSGRTRLRNADNTESEVIYIMMQYIEEPEKLMTRTLLVPEATDIMIQVANALNHAHNFKDENGMPHSIIHRDLKPDNILVDKDGIVHVADVGVGKDLKDKSAAETVSGLTGTPSFMSPEQAKGLEVDCPTDIYSWGTTFFYLLTKSLPFDGDTPLAILNKVREREDSFKVTEENPDVPLKLSEIIEICTNQYPEYRFDAAELVHALDMYKKTFSYMKKDKDEVIESTKRPWTSKFRKTTKEELVNLIRAHEKASWFTGGKDRRNHQQKVIDYYKQLQLKDVDEEEIPADLDLAVRVIQKQMYAIEITPEIEPVKLEGRGRGKKNAERLYNKLRQEAGKFWIMREFASADTIVQEVKREWNGIRDKWKPALKDYIHQFEVLIDGSKKAQEALAFITECHNYLVRDNIDRALKAYGEAENKLNRASPEYQNQHVDQARAKLAKADESVKRELVLYRVNQAIEDMAANIEQNQFPAAHQAYSQIMVDLQNLPPSDKGKRLRHKAQAMQSTLVKYENFHLAEQLHIAAKENMDERTENGYKEALRKSVRIEGIIAEHLQGDEAGEIEFRADFKKFQEDLSKRSRQFEEFCAIADEYQEKIYPMYEENIAKKFSDGEFPDLMTLRKFHSGIKDLIKGLGKIKKESVGPEYEAKQQGMIRLQMEVATKEREYVNARFREVEDDIERIKEKNSQEDNKFVYGSALEKLRINRQVINLIDNAEVYHRYDQIEEKLRVQYDFAGVVGRARAEILDGLYDEARRTLARVSEERQQDAQMYLKIIELEEKARVKLSLDQRAKSDSPYFLQTDEGLNDEAVLGYKQTVKDFKKSEEVHQVMFMLDDIENKVGFEENPVSELREMVDSYSRKREGASKNEAKEEIMEQLTALVGSAESYLETNGKPVLTRDTRIALGTSYQDAGFKEKAREFF